MDCAILLGSRALGAWDDQSDLDIIVIHQIADDNSQERSVVGLAVKRLRQLHYPGYLAYESPHHEVIHGLMLQTPDDYRAHRRTLNHVMARAAREGLVFCKEPGNEHRYRHDGDASNEWELVTTKRLRQAASENRMLADITRFWPPRPVNRTNVNTVHGRTPTGCCGTRERRSCPSWAPSTPGTPWQRWPSPSPSTTPAGATSSRATLTASTSIPPAGARWSSPTPSRTCRACGRTWSRPERTVGTDTRPQRL